VYLFLDESIPEGSLLTVVMVDPEGIIADFEAEIEVSDQTDISFTISELMNGGFFKKITKVIKPITKVIGKINPGSLISKIVTKIPGVGKVLPKIMKVTGIGNIMQKISKIPVIGTVLKVM